ncbi:Anti-sigma regulatory factor (Ser/Thr protein kinase) [Streptomyces sp. yr375]|uniref:ATP-binding protein n=1 Tax=Streptomyces sp. yr375 TaxID=1761906 RepID=UPI0008B3FFA8|nr:ATP-binding protein [Streptomyces sp. yr375]SER42406.1 Anti-sigma regulatory factor (Ser/Thr protein kinase) [Streptomyces sp. yr375]
MSDSWEYSLYIPTDPRAVTVCRRTLRLVLTLHGLGRIVDTAELLGSELMSNVVLHTKGPACLRLRFRDGILQIGAWDADPEPPAPAPALEELGEAENGRGMALVRACSDLWHWQPLSRMGHRGKLVWCELNAA